MPSCATRGIFEQRLLRVPQLVGNRRNIARRPVSGNQEQRRVVEKGCQLLDQAAMQLDGLVVAVGEFGPERQLTADRLVEPIEDNRQFATCLPDTGNELPRVGRDRPAAAVLRSRSSIRSMIVC